MSALDVLTGFVPGAILRATLLLAAVTATAPLLRRARPETRHALWGTALVMTVILVAALPFVPRLGVVLPGEVAPAFVPPAREDATGRVVARGSGPAVASELPSTGQKVAPEGGNPGTVPRAAALALLIGVTLVAIWFAGRRGALAMTAARSRPVRDQETLTRLRRLADRVGVGREVRLLRGGVSVPVTWGTLRPSILLPSASRQWSATRLDCVLLHELAHVRRHDALVQDLARLACALHWYNPLAWRALRHLRAEAEAACDGIVLRAGVPPAGYAGALVAALEDAVAGVGTAGVTMATAGGIEDRVRSVLRGPRPGSLRGSAAAVAIAVGIAAVFAGTATVVRGGVEAGPSPRDPIVAALVQALDDEAPFVRRSAINALRDVRDPDGIESIRPLLGDPDPDVRRAAEVVLGLRPALPNKPIAQERPPRLEGPELETAIDALQADDPRTRERAAGGLQAARDRRAVAALVAALEDPDEHVRRQAAESLGWIADPAATPALIDATRDPDPHVRHSAVGALGAIGRGAVRSGLARPPVACEPPDGVLASLARTTVAAEVRALLVEPDPERRTRAGWSLGRLVTADRPGPMVNFDKHDPRNAREALTIAVYDPHRPVRLAAACSLARIGDARAVEHLERRTSDPEGSIAAAAEWAVERIRRRAASG